MSGNQLLTISDITQDSLPILANKLVQADKINRQFDDEFGVKGRKIGDTANIRLPARYVGTFGAALGIEPVTEQYMPITVLYQFHIGVQFTTAQLLLSADDFNERYLSPAMAALANRFDSDCCYYFMQQIANRGGTPGVRPTSYLAFSDSSATLVSEGMPQDATDNDPCAILHPFASSSMADSLKGLFNPQANISDFLETGLIARKTAGLDWYRDANIPSYKLGTLTGAPVLAGVTQASGGSAIITQGWAGSGFINLSGLTNNAAQCRVGDTIQIAGLYPVNPQSREVYVNSYKQFVVIPPAGYSQMIGPAGPGGPKFAPATLTNGTFDPATGLYTSSGAGLLQVAIAEAIITGGQFQNCSADTSVFTGTPAVTINGGAAAGTRSFENQIFHRDALAAVTVELPIPRTAREASRASNRDLALSIRTITDYTINNDAEPTRIDICYGIAPLYRQLGFRVSG